MSARVSYCTFDLGDQRFGIEVGAVREVLRDQAVTRVPLAPAAVTGLVNLRGRIVSAIDLRLCFGLEGARTGRAGILVVLRESLGDVSFIVDEIRDVCDADPESFETTPPTMKGIGRELIRGAHKLSDRLLLVLDIAKTLDAASA
jgi:purine-binding chemotaxis protein CheW